MTRTASDAAPPGSTPDAREELRKEAYTVALYVSVCLLAALTAVGERAEASHVEVIGLPLTWHLDSESPPSTGKTSRGAEKGSVRVPLIAGGTPLG